MSAVADKFAVVEEQASGDVFQGSHAVGDDEGGSVFGESFQGVLDEAVAFIVECGGGFVEDQDRRVLEEGSGDGDPLPLATGKGAAAFAQNRIEAFG